MIRGLILITASALLLAAADDNPPIPVDRPRLLRKVEPVYPPLAVQYRIQGTVRFTAIVGKDGQVESLRLVSGHPVLVSAARAAALQWVFRPTLVKGERVRIVTRIDVPFRLDPYGRPPAQNKPEAEGQTRT